MAKLVSHENNRAVYTMEIEWDAFDAQVEKVYRKNKNRFQIPGFRKGKASRKVIEMSYGSGVFFEDALNDLLPEAIEQATKELELEPIGRPSVDVDTVEKKQPVVITITTETMPHPTLGDYKNMEVGAHPAHVDESEVDHVINQEREKNAVMRPVDREVQDGDMVVIDYSGSVDGEKFEGGTAEQQTLVIGSHSFIPGFEEQLIGHKAGESFDIQVTFPEEYHAEDLKGKDAAFAIVLHEVQVKEMPEADDEFAQDVSEYDTMEEYRQSVYDHLMEHAEERAQNQKQNDAVAKLVEISGIEPPQALVDEQVEVEIRNFANQLQGMGISLDQYINFGGASMETLREQYEPTAKLRVSGDLALGALVEEQKFEATDEEVEAEMKELAETYGAKDPEDFLKRMKEMGQESLVADDVRKKKALDYLVSQVKWVDPPVEEETSEAEANEAEEEK